MWILTSPLPKILQFEIKFWVEDQMLKLLFMSVTSVYIIEIDFQRFQIIEKQLVYTKIAETTVPCV